MRRHNPFWLTGTTRGIHDHGDVIRVYRNGRCTLRATKFERRF